MPEPLEPKLDSPESYLHHEMALEQNAFEKYIIVDRILDQNEIKESEDQCVDVSVPNEIDAIDADNTNAKIEISSKAPVVENAPIDGVCDEFDNKKDQIGSQIDPNFANNHEQDTARLGQENSNVDVMQLARNADECNEIGSPECKNDAQKSEEISFKSDVLDGSIAEESISNEAGSKNGQGQDRNEIGDKSLEDAIRSVVFEDSIIEDPVSYESDNQDDEHKAKSSRKDASGCGNTVPANKSNSDWVSDIPSSGLRAFEEASAKPETPNFNNVLG